MKGTIQKLARLTVFLLFAVFFSSAIASAQVENQQPLNNPNQQTQEKPAQNLKLDEVLELTKEQRIQIREIRQRMQPQNQMVNRRVQIARRALDEAIYADEPDEALIEQRARELAEAQTEQVKARATTEYQIRRVLTNEQLKKFRFLRMMMMRQDRLRQQLKRAEQDRTLRDNQQPMLRPRQNPNNFPIRNRIKQNQSPIVSPSKKQATKPQ